MNFILKSDPFQLVNVVIKWLALTRKSFHRLAWHKAFCYFSLFWNLRSSQVSHTFTVWCKGCYVCENCFPLLYISTGTHSLPSMHLHEKIIYPITSTKNIHNNTKWLPTFCSLGRFKGPVVSFIFTLSLRSFICYVYKRFSFTHTVWQIINE